MNILTILKALEHERGYQTGKWGTLDEHGHEVGTWLTLIRRELREAEDAWCTQRGDRHALAELVHVAATCVAALEQHGLGIYYHDRRVRSDVPLIRQKSHLETTIEAVLHQLEHGEASDLLDANNLAPETYLAAVRDLRQCCELLHDALELEQNHADT